MRELIVFADVTLDGFMAEPDNDLDFMVGNDELDQAFMRELMTRADTIVVGRPTLPRLLMIDLNATIVNVAPPSIQEHLGYSRARVAVGCGGCARSMP